MAIRGATLEDYNRCKRHGGTVQFQLDRSDLKITDEFERSLADAGTLRSGFQLPPAVLDYASPGERAQIFTLAEGWTRLAVDAHLHGAKPSYAKQPDGSYEALITFPTPQNPGGGAD